jgi:hypothetical protein
VPAAPATPDNKDLPVLPPTVNPRNAVLADLHKRSLVETASTESDLVPFNEEDPSQPPSGQEPDEDRERLKAAMAVVGLPTGTEEGQEPAAITLEGTPPAEVPGAIAKKYKTMVRGQEVELDEKDVIDAGLEAVRHHGAAQAALREASELLAAAREHRKAAGGAETPAAPATPSSPAAPDADAIAMADAIQNGSRDDAARAIAALLTRGADSGKLEETIARTVETRIRDKTDQDRAAAELEKLVPEVLKDQRVVVLLANEERAARAAGDMRPYSQLYPEIATKIRGWLDGLKAPSGGAPPTPPGVDATLQARAAAKAATPAPVTGQSARQPAQPQTKVPTGSEIVAKMRAARFQQNRI